MKGPPTGEARVSVHEAGHAVLYDYAGYRIRWLDLRWSGNGRLGAKTAHDPITADAAAAMDDDALCTYIAATVAGIQAEGHLLRVHGFDPEQNGVQEAGLGDRRDLGAIQKICGRTEEHFTKLLREGTDLACRVLRERWSTVVAVAIAAVEAPNQRLAGWEVRKIIQATEHKAEHRHR